MLTHIIFTEWATTVTAPPPPPLPKSPIKFNVPKISILKKEAVTQKDVSNKNSISQVLSRPITVADLSKVQLKRISINKENEC